MTTSAINRAVLCGRWPQRGCESQSPSGTDGFLEVSELLLTPLSKIPGQTSTREPPGHLGQLHVTPPHAHRQGSTVGKTSKTTPSLVKPTVDSGKVA